jgi:hypothetical protein
MDSRIGPGMSPSSPPLVPLDRSYPETPPYNLPEGVGAGGSPYSIPTATSMDDTDQEDRAEPGDTRPDEGDAAQEEAVNKLELTGVEKAFVIGVCLVAATALVMAIWDFSGL